MFKKTKYTLICLLAIMLTVLAFTACKSEHTPSDEPDDPSGSIQRPEENDPDHVHTTGDVVVEDKVEATCKSEGSYYEVLYCTECNKAISKKKVTTDKLSQHTYANGTCTVCGETQKFSEGLAYEEVLGKCIVTGIGSCKDTDIVIPEEYNGKPVVGIKEEAFYWRTNLKSIIIPDSVTSIGNSAFYRCEQLTSISIPNGVTSIGEYTFSYCYSLASIDMSDNIKSIGKSAFENCHCLTSIDIPNTVANIDSNAFEGCNSLTSIEIPSGVTSIGSHAFSGCSNLTGVVINNGVTSIGWGTFSECTKLSSIVIPASVTSVEEWAFYGCIGLISVEIGNSVASIANLAFSNCYKLVEVINKSSLDIIAGSSDYGEIAYYAQVVHDGESVIRNIDDYLFITSDGVNYLLGYIGRDATFELPKNFNGENYSIYKYAFSHCYELTNISIPNSVTSIGDSAFSYCTMTDITIPDSVTYLGDRAFEHCGQLTSIVIGSGVTSIGKETFSWCNSLKSIIISKSVTNIGESAFFLCDNLTMIAYTGAESEWKKIEIDDSNYSLTSATILYNYTE